jgi:hypothetical protein
LHPLQFSQDSRPFVDLVFLRGDMRESIDPSPQVVGKKTFLSVVH